MGSGDIVVGKHQTSEPRKSTGKNKPENPAGALPEPARPRQVQMCAAMTQQAADSAIVSQPQEFVRLIGCRERKVRQQGGT